MSSPLPPNPPINSGSSPLQKASIIIVGISILILVASVGYLAYVKFSTSNTAPEPILSEEPEPESAQETPAPSAYTSTEQTNYTIPLYNLSLDLPKLWTVTETNRRPEPTNPGDPITGHDCADYTITDPNHYISLSIKPTCGFVDGGASDWPPDATIVEKIDQDSSIIRFPTKENNLGYGTGYKTPELTVSGTDQLYTDKITINKSGVVGSGSGDILFTTIRVNYTGPVTRETAVLTAADQIISSLVLSR